MNINIKKLAYIFIVLTVMFNTSLRAEVETEQLIIKDSSISELTDSQVKFGMFITNLHDINFAKNEFEVEFWSWFISNRSDYSPKERTEIVNSKKFSIRNNTKQKIENYTLHSQVFKGTIKQHWNIKRFPFDTQKLTISLEDTIDTTDNINFVLDNSSSIANDIIPDGWELLNFNLGVSNTNYPTTFGDPRVSKDNNYEFSRATATITLKRNGTRIFITAFLGLFVATILIMIVFSINSFKQSISVIPLQPRITLCVGSLFAAVGSIYSLSNKVPYTTSFTLSDSLQITTFIGIAFAIISSVASDILLKAEKQNYQKVLMRSIWILFIVFHFGFNGIIVVNQL
jgi:hypothetical protein